MKICLFLFLFVLSQNLISQTYPYKHYTTDDGLSQNQVTCLAQDKQGFIWVGTKGGLNRFDGVSFEVFGKKDGLLSSNITKLATDRNGILWILSGKGLTKYTNEKFISYRFPDPKLVCGDFVIAEDRIYLNTYKINHNRENQTFYFENGSFRKFEASNQILSPFVSACLYNPEYGLIIRDDLTKSIVCIGKNHKMNLLCSFPKETLRAITNDKSNHLLLVINDTVWKIKDKQKIPVVAIKQRDLLYSVFSNSGKLYLFNPLNSYEVFDGQNLATIKWPYDQITCALFDQENVLWIGTEFGLYRQINNAFVNFTEKDGLNKNIWSAVEDKDQNIWFASFGYGLQRFNGNTFEKIDVGPSWLFNKLHYYMGSRCLSNGKIWFTNHFGILEYNKKKFKEIKLSENVSSTFYVFENKSDSSVWVSSISGLFRFHNNRVQQYTEKDGLPGNILCITRDKQGILWLVGRGLTSFDGTRFFNFDPAKLPFGSSACIEADSIGNIWIGGPDGLFVYDGKTFAPVFPDGKNPQVNAIINMDNQNLLVGRFDDIVMVNLPKFSRKEKDFYRNFGRPEGFLGKECGQNGIMKDSHGKYWILSSDMVSCFDPSAIKRNTAAPRLYIRHLEYMNDSMTWKTLSGTNFVHRELYRLSRNQKNIRITFTAISTNNPENISFRYRLKGYQNNWSLPTTIRNASYTNLQPGNYKFEVEAANADGVWTSLPTTCTFYIKPAFWQTWTFRIAVIAAAIALVTFLALIIQHRRTKKNREKEMLSKEFSKLQVSTILRQFDPHFTFNAISSIGSLIMQGNSEKAYLYFVKLSVLLRAALGQQERLTNPLAKELEFVRNYCEIQKLRFEERFDYAVEIAENTNLDTEVPKMIIQTFTENALKHGIEPRAGGGKIIISIKQELNMVKISITDNGIGRAAARNKTTPGTRSGNKLTERLFELMNQHNQQKILLEVVDLYNPENEPAGTQVNISIPLKYTYL